MFKRYNIDIIRPEVKESDIKLRGQGFSKDRLKKIKAGLLTFHTLECMATNIYRFQISGKQTDLDKLLIAAMLNEMTHIQDFEIKLLEYGFKPTCKRYAYQIVGFCFGFFSKLMGEKQILKTGIWVESQAVAHYAELLKDIEWDEDTKKVIEKDQADEDGHIGRWSEMLKKLG